MTAAAGVVGMGVVGTALFNALGTGGYGVAGVDADSTGAEWRAVAHADVVFVCVDTPPAPQGPLSTINVFHACSTIRRYAPLATIALRSTVPPGTTAHLASLMRGPFAYVPEFLVERDPVGSMRNPDRHVVGVDELRPVLPVFHALRAIAPAAPIVVRSTVEAELAKLCSNAMLAAKVAMANQLRDVCADYAVSWDAVRAVVGLDRRIGPDHLDVRQPRGFGGSCLPKDLDGLIAAAEGDVPLLKAIRDYNERLRS